MRNLKSSEEVTTTSSRIQVGHVFCPTETASHLTKSAGRRNGALTVEQVIKRRRRQTTICVDNFVRPLVMGAQF